MYRDKRSIKEAFRSGLPFYFGTNSSVEFAKFRKKFEAVTQYARVQTSSFLTEGTIRYQLILLYSSFIWVIIHYFGLTELNILDQTLEVNEKLVVAFPFFTGILAAIFISKVFLDYRVHQIDIGPSEFSVTDAIEYMNLGQGKARIDEHYWPQLFDKIEHARQVYREASDAAMESSHQRNIPEMSSRLPEIDDLRKIRKLDSVIATRESFSKEVSDALAVDIQTFQTKASEALAFYDERLVHEIGELEDRFSLNWERSKRIKDAYDAVLSKWLDARNDLVRERVNVVIGSSEYKRASQLLRTLKRAKWIRTATLIMEIAFPILFAVLVQTIYWRDILLLIQGSNPAN